MIKFIKRHLDIFTPILLLLACYVFLFHQMGSYHLIDVDETRYAAMAREMLQKHNWLTLYLDNNVFFEKPPLYFWMLASSYKLFGHISELTARFPIALTATFAVFATYCFGKKAVSRLYGLISALILLTSVEFLLLSRIAILDMVLSTFFAVTILSGFLTYFCEEKNKKYFWWLAYFFCALAVLAKGLPGVILPFGVLFVTSFVTGNLKDMFKPVNILPGAFIFFLVALPWHILMYKAHGYAFIHEYFIKHHFARFIDSKNIGRIEPFYYFIPVFAVGFIPWIFDFIAFTVQGFTNIIDQLKTTGGSVVEKIKSVCAKNKLLTITNIYFWLVFLFFSSSSTKLATYILPLFPAAALLTGYYWNEYVVNNKNEKGIKIGTIIMSAIFIVVGIGGLVAGLIIKKPIPSDISQLIYLASIWFAIMGAVFLLILRSGKKMALFVSKVVFMVGIILITVNFVFPVVINGGEGDLIEFATYTKNINNSELVTFNYGVRPSTLFYYGRNVYFIVEPDYKALNEVVSKNKNTYVIVKNNQMEEVSPNLKFVIVKKGVKYTLVKDVKSK